MLGGMRSVLVIGGTGPTGPPIVNGLVERGFDVTILHTGTHELAEVDHVPHLHGDVRSLEGLTEVLGDLTFDIVVATYGRLRAVAEVLAGRCEHFVSVGGMPAYRGYFNADLHDPPGLPVPTREGDPTSTEAEDGKSYRIRRTEEYVFQHHPTATHFRYPMVYGPRQLAPREWSVVRRVLDGRPHIVVPDGGLTLNTMGYTDNLAHAIHLAVEQPEAAGGHIFNVADDEQLTIAQVVDLIADEMGHTWDVVSMPYDLAPCTRPLVGQNRTTHKIMSTDKLRTLLGYQDVVPARDAIQATARWLVDNPPEYGGKEEYILEDPFDYAAEDRLVAAWRAAMDSIPVDVAKPSSEEFAAPGYGLSYGGPGATHVRPDTRI